MANGIYMDEEAKRGFLGTIHEALWLEFVDDDQENYDYMASDCGFDTADAATRAEMLAGVREYLNGMGISNTEILGFILGHDGMGKPIPVSATEIGTVHETPDETVLGGKGPLPFQ